MRPLFVFVLFLPQVSLGTEDSVTATEGFAVRNTFFRARKKYKYLKISIKPCFLS